MTACRNSACVLSILLHFILYILSCQKFASTFEKLSYINTKEIKVVNEFAVLIVRDIVVATTLRTGLVER